MSVQAKKAPRCLFRAMRRGDTGTPPCGSTANQLGVRPRDIQPASDEMVHPGTGGMSVTPDDPARLPPHARPPWLGGLGKLAIFRLEVAALPPSLGVRLDPKHPERHAFIEPATAMTLNEYQTALCSTGPFWCEVTE
jgi:hypothetical protein